VIGGHLGIVSGVQPCNHIVQYSKSIRCHLTIVPDTLQPEPDGVSAVVACAAAPAEQVRNQAMAQAAAVREDEDASLVETSRNQHQASHRDESVAAPVAEDAV